MVLELSPRGQKNLAGQEWGAGKASVGRVCVWGVPATALSGARVGESGVGYFR